VLLIILLTISNIGQSQIKLLTNGRVGIGTITPSRGLDILVPDGVKFRFVPDQYTPSAVFLDRYYGDTRFYPEINHKGYIGNYCNFWYYIYADKLWYVDPPAQYSDIKFKKNVSDLENSLEKILSLKGVKYDLDLAAFGNTGPKSDNAKKEYGLIAQDVLNVIPDIVEKDSLGYAINYTSLIPVLIEAIKEQQQQIEELRNELLKKSAEEESIETPVQNADPYSYLGKNKPNPFYENTTIEFYLGSSVKEAALYIYDLQGRQIKSIKTSGTEYGYVTINGSELQPGIYNYSLIADGIVIGLERMILTK